MKVGVDLDGTISWFALWNPRIRLPAWLFAIWLPVVLFGPNKEARSRLQDMHEEGNEIIIVSARPPWMTSITRRWLRRHQIPFDKIFCVSFGKGTQKRKMRVIKEEGVDLFIDNDKELVALLQKQGIQAEVSFP